MRYPWCTACEEKDKAFVKVSDFDLFRAVKGLCLWPLHGFASGLVWDLHGFAVFLGCVG